MKRKSRQMHRIKIASTKPSRQNVRGALETFAPYFMEAERKLTPLFINEHWPVNEALVLIAMYADAFISGEDPKNHSIAEREILGSANMLVMMWKEGLFIPSPKFPYTLEDFEKSEEERPDDDAS